MSKKKGHATKPTPTKPKAGAEEPAKDNFEVGYKRPPIHTRFKPGVSPYPKGRPPGRANTKTTVARVINETVPVRDGTKTRKMTKLEAMLQAHTLKAAKGDARSAGIVIGLITKMGMLGEPETATLAALSEEDDAILADYLRRHTAPPEGHGTDDSEAR